ncbi:MAG: DMT family transporter [Anaerolineales bacterium]|nr:DMT family transporter [Anaerolineales bacterium]
MSRTTRANLLLLLTAAIWGFAFVAQRVGAVWVGSFTLNAVRFGMGAAMLAPLVYYRLEQSGVRVKEELTPRGILPGVLATGVVLFGAVSLQQIGLETTTAGKAGFITGLYVVLVPLISTLRGERPGLRVVASVLLAAVGLYFLSISSAWRMEAGDALVFAGAFLWALHVQLVGWLSRRIEPLLLAVLQFMVCAVLSAGAALLVEPAPFSGLSAALVPILYAGFISVGVAYSLQAVAQREADPTPAALIMSLEAVFAALGGWMILGEMLSPRNLVGCGLMLAGMILSQLPSGENDSLAAL